METATKAQFSEGLLAINRQQSKFLEDLNEKNLDQPDLTDSLVAKAKSLNNLLLVELESF